MTRPAVATYERTRMVFVGDDDGSGLVYFPAYYHYMSEGDQELFEDLGHPVGQQLTDRIAGPAVHTACDYVSPAHAGDLLTQTIELTLGEHCSTATRHVFATQDGRVVARGQIVRCWVELQTMAKQPVPDWLRALEGARAT